MTLSMWYPYEIVLSPALKGREGFVGWPDFPRNQGRFQPSAVQLHTLIPTGSPGYAADIAGFRCQPGSMGRVLLAHAGAARRGELTNRGPKRRIA